MAETTGPQPSQSQPSGTLSSNRRFYKNRVPVVEIEVSAWTSRTFTAESFAGPTDRTGHALSRSSAAPADNSVASPDSDSSLSPLSSSDEEAHSEYNPEDHRAEADRGSSETDTDGEEQEESEQDGVEDEQVGDASYEADLQNIAETADGGEVDEAGQYDSAKEAHLD